MAAKNSGFPDEYREDFVEKVDKRTTLGRLVRDRLTMLENDLGGRDALSYQRRSLAKRVVWTEVMIEQREAALSRGEKIDVGALIQANNALVGLLKTVGLDRQRRDVPTLQDYLDHRDSQS